MPEPLGTAVLDRLPDRLGAEGFTGVNREVEVLALAVLERVEVLCGRVTLLGPGDVEADHATVAPAHGELGDLERVGCGAHGCAQRADANAPPGRALGETPHDGLSDLVQAQPVVHVKFGREANLGVDHAVVCEVLGALGGDACERIRGLHDADGVGERLEVEREVVTVRATLEPFAERGLVGGGQRVVVLCRCELDHGAGTQATVEVVVQQRLGGPADLLDAREALGCHESAYPARFNGRPGRRSHAWD